MKTGSLFSGAGGLDMAVEEVFGARTVWHAEIDPAASKVLAHRYPGVPNLGDVSAVDWSTVEPVDVLTGGFPCQDLSLAGKRAGLRDGTRSGLWNVMADAIDALRPGLIIIENVRGILSAEAHSDVEPCPWCLGDAAGSGLRALGAVLGDLADLGYDARWRGLRAADVGAPHGRFRVFIVAADTRRENGQRRPDAFTGGDRRPQSADRPELSSATTPDAAHVGHERGRPARDGRDGSTDSRGPTADPQGNGRYEGRTEPARLIGRPDAPERRHAATDADRDGREGVGRVEPVGRDTHRRGSADRAGRDGQPETPTADADDDTAGDRCEPRHSRGSAGEPAQCGGRVEWGQYEPAIRRWESVLGRVAPAPTETAPKGGQRLSPRLVEWMMGWPDGWVTDVPGVSRNDALRICGNGVVPQQAAAALRLMLAAEAVAA